MAKSNSKKLKIGLVLDDTLDSSDGVQQYLLTIGEWLGAQGHEVHYLVGQTTRTDIANIHSLSRNIKVRFNGNRLSLPLPVSRRRVRYLLRTEQFDVLHIQMPYSPLLAQPIIQAASPKTAVIGTFHILPYSPFATIGNALLAILLKPSLKRFDSIVSVSSAAQDFSSKWYGIRSELLPNAIDYQRFASAYVKKATTPTIIFLGRLVPRKGCIVLLQAVAELRRSTPDLRFNVRIGGKGPLKAELERYTSEQKLSDVVRFDGFVPESDKPNYYVAADIAVFPSSGGESFGIVLAEAMASGSAAVLAGDNPGYRAVMQPQSDLLFAPKDAKMLAHKLKRLIEDASYRQAMARWGASYSQRFDVEVVGLQLLRQYQEALRKRANL